MSYESQFDILELIGKGSFGNVRKLRRKCDGMLCVRKEISYSHMSSKERQQLIDEFRILGSLQNPNIVQYIFHEHLPERHMVYLYMEYCDGGDLSDVIKRYKKLNTYVPEELIWSYLTQLVLALYKCHYGVDPPVLKNIFHKGYESDDSTAENNGSDSMNKSSKYKYSTSEKSDPKEVNNEMIVIHRDIKPDNIFLLKDNNVVKLGDFGLAKLLFLDKEFATTYVGTPYYMSPEVLMDKPYTPLSDIWSLGCVLYELCCLHPPFQAKTHLQLQNKIKLGEFPPIPDIYSQKLRLTITACLQVEYEQRPSCFVLLQESSIKLFRKELELSAKQAQLLQWEKRLKLKELKVQTHLNLMAEELNKDCVMYKMQLSNDFNAVVSKVVKEKMELWIAQQQKKVPAPLKQLNGVQESYRANISNNSSSSKLYKKHIFDDKVQAKHNNGQMIIKRNDPCYDEIPFSNDRMMDEFNGGF